MTDQCWHTGPLLPGQFCVACERLNRIPFATPKETTMLTADNITDEDIREYARDHWRDPWMGGGPGRGTVNDAMAIALAKSHPEMTYRTRGQFAALINARTSPLTERKTKENSK